MIEQHDSHLSGILCWVADIAAAYNPAQHIEIFINSAEFKRIQVYSTSSSTEGWMIKHLILSQQA